MRMRKRSICDSGSGYVPWYSTGFCVAITMKGSGRGYERPSIVTWRSFIASSKADWVLGVVRLISSASKKLVKMGPGLNSNASRVLLYTVTPTTSLGSMSLVNWMRWKPLSRLWASVWARVVLPTPGTSSISRCPRASRHTTAKRSTSALPRITRASDCSSAVTRAASSMVGGLPVDTNYHHSRPNRLPRLAAR